MKKAFATALSLIILVTCMSNAAYADTSEDEQILTPDDFINSENFEPITREEYIAGKAQEEGVSYSEAEASLNQKIEAAKQEVAGPLIMPLSWTGDTMRPNSDSTTTIFGRVSAIYTHSSNLKAIYYTQATIIASHYGKTWVDCYANGGADPYGSGEFTFIGSSTGAIISNTRLRLTISGYFQVAKTYAETHGISYYFTGTSTIGTTVYLRDNIYGTHIEVLTQSS